MLGFLPTRAYRPGTPGATTFLSPLSGTFNYGWDSFQPSGALFKARERGMVEIHDLVTRHAGVRASGAEGDART